MHPQRILVQSSGAALLLWVYVFSLNAQTPDTECFAGPKDRLGVIQAQDRQLDFPSDFDNATISLFDQPKPSETMTGFFSFPSLGREIGAASGQVTVPANAFVSITVVASDRYLDFIESLPDRGIDRLELRGATISTRLLRLLESKQSFRQLEFVDCKLTEVDGSSLNGAPQLQQVYIESSESIDINRTLLPWLAKCPSLQTMSNGLVLNSDDLKSIKNHRAPLFIKVELRNTVAETVQLLNEIPGLVGVEIVVAGDVTTPDLEHLSHLKTIELIVLNGGSLDSSLLRAISRIPKLRTIRTHPGTRINGTVLNVLPDLLSIESITFGQPLEEGLQNRWVESLLAMPKLRELPELKNVTASQLQRIGLRGKYSRLDFSGLDASATVEMVENAIRKSPNLKSLEISKMLLTSQLGSAISQCSELEDLRLDLKEFDAQKITSSAQLSKLKRLNVSSMKQPKRLDCLRELPSLSQLRVSFNTFDPLDCAAIASIPSLISLSVQGGLCNDAFAKSLREAPNLRFLGCGQDCLMTDVGIEYLAECEQLESISVGGFVSETAIESLSALARLKNLMISSDRLDTKAIERLRQHFPNLENIDIRLLNLSAGEIAQGEDGFFRWVPPSGRAVPTAMEGRSLDELLPVSTMPDVLAKLDGKVVLVEFWGTWCGPCLGYHPELERLYEKYRDQGLQFLSVHSQQGTKNVGPYLESHPIEWPNIVDVSGDIEKNFNVPSFPSLYLFDTKGKLVVALPHRLLLEQSIKKQLSLP